MNELKFKSDNFKKDRWWYSRCLDIYCEKCEKLILKYQKDWPWPLKRMYLDRILLDINTENNWSNFSCWNCKIVIWTNFIYEKEDRKAIRLYQNSVIKKIIKLN